MKVIFFPIENYSREIDARLGIIKSIKEKNKGKYLFIITPKNFLTPILKRLNINCTIFHKSLQEHFLRFIEKYISKGSKVTFIEEEYFDRYSDNNLRFGKNLKLISCAFASTNNDFKSLKRRIGGDKVLFSGNPRVDIIRNIGELYKLEIKNLKDKYGKFLVFNSNFSYVNNPNDHVLENLRNEWFLNNPKEYEKLKLFIKKHRKRYLKLVEYLKNSPDLNHLDNIIYRCHPNESKKKATKEFINTRVKVFSTDNVLLWISSSEYMMHCACTTSIEAFLMNKKSVFFEPFDEEKNSFSFGTSKEFIIDNKIQLNNEFNNLKINKKNPINLQLPIEQRTKSEDLYLPACDKIAEWLERNTPSTNETKFYFKIINSFTIALPRLILTLISEKERSRINARISKSLHIFNLKSIIISDFLGFAIIK